MEIPGPMFSPRLVSLFAPTGHYFRFGVRGVPRIADSRPLCSPANHPPQAGQVWHHCTNSQAMHFAVKNCKTRLVGATSPSPFDVLRTATPSRAYNLRVPLQAQRRRFKRVLCVRGITILPAPLMRQKPPSRASPCVLRVIIPQVLPIAVQGLPSALSCVGRSTSALPASCDGSTLL